MALNIQTKDDATPGLRAFIAGLKNKRPMLRLIGNRVKTLVRDHLIKRSQTVRNKLGAPSSGFWGQAAEKVARAPQTIDQDSVSISLEHPGVGRAFGPVTIRPLAGKKYLTIPLIAAAYNKRARRIKDLFPVFKKGAQVGTLRKRGKDGKAHAWFALVKQVNQKQDRSILPTDQQLEAAGLQGVNDYVTLLMQRKGAQ